MKREKKTGLVLRYFCLSSLKLERILVLLSFWRDLSLYIFCTCLFCLFVEAIWCLRRWNIQSRDSLFFFSSIKWKYSTSSSFTIQVDMFGIFWNAEISTRIWSEVVRLNKVSVVRRAFLKPRQKGLRCQGLLFCLLTLLKLTKHRNFLYRCLYSELIPPAQCMMVYNPWLATIGCTFSVHRRHFGSTTGYNKSHNTFGHHYKLANSPRVPRFSG